MAASSAKNSGVSNRRHKEVPVALCRRLRFQVFPRLMTKAQAANYCGVCVESFAVNCPVEPIRIRSGEKGLRWDTHDLDEWMESKEQDLIGSNGVDWLKRVG